jgi:nucleoside-diphosphate-sugar epimerase
MAKKVFLTGCTGEIGSRLTLCLLALGYEVFGVRGSKECKIVSPRHTCRRLDLLDPLIELGLEGIVPDILVHTAWFTTPKEFWESDCNIEWIEASKRIISAYVQSGGKYLVVTGSCAEYSWNTTELLSENSLESPASMYGRAKLELLNWIRGIDIPFLWTRTFFQFGMNEPEGRLIPEVIDSLLNEDQFVVKRGKDIRDYVYVEDVSKILALLISDGIIGILNIGSGVEVEVGVITLEVSDIIGRRDLLRFEKSETQKSYVVSNPEKLYSMIGLFPWTPLKSALIASIEARKR